MHGQTRSGARRYYRCAARARYPGIADAHPRDVLVSEQPIINALDDWLSELFAPERAADTAQTIVAALDNGTSRAGEIETARRRVSTSRREIERCRTALQEAGSPAAQREILTWLDEAAADKEHAEAALAAAMQLTPPPSPARKVLAVVQHHGGLIGILDQATPEERAALYDAMHVTAVFNPEANEVRLGVDPVASTACRRGLEPPHPFGHQPLKLARLPIPPLRRGRAIVARGYATSGKWQATG